MFSASGFFSGSGFLLVTVDSLAPVDQTAQIHRKGLLKSVLSQSSPDSLVRSLSVGTEARCVLLLFCFLLKCLCDCIM